MKLNSRKALALGFAAAMGGIALVGPASATIAQLVGDWKNVNPNTRDVVRLLITDKGGVIDVEVWGACSPTPCNWGTVRAVPYAPNVSAPLPADAQFLEADYQQGFAQSKVIIGPAPGPGGELRAMVLTRFTDGSGRSSYENTDLFRK